MPASELKALEETPKAFDAALHAANFRPLVFNLKVAEDTYNDETRIKKSVNRFVEPMAVHSRRDCSGVHSSQCLLSPSGLSPSWCHHLLHALGVLDAVIFGCTLRRRRDKALYDCHDAVLEITLLQSCAMCVVYDDKSCHMKV